MNNPIFDTYFSIDNNKKKGRIPVNQINIIRYLARNGKQRKATITESLKKNFAEIFNAIKEVEAKGLIKKVEITTKKNTKPKNFYALTIEGFKVAIDDPLEIEPNTGWKLITNEQFWNVLKDSFNESSKESIKSICSLYEKKIIKVSKEYVIPLIFYSTFNDFKKQTFEKSEITKDKNEEVIITNIGYGKPLTLDEILKIKGLKTMIIKLQDKEIKITKESYIDKLYKKGLLVKTKYGDKGKYDLSHLGLMQLLFYLYREASIHLINKHIVDEQSLDAVEKSKSLEAKSFINTFNKIRKKYAYLLPEIFNGENHCNLGIGSYELLWLLVKTYFDEPYWRLEGDVVGDEEDVGKLLNSMNSFQKIRWENYQTKLSNFVMGGFEKIITNSKLFDKDNITSEFSKNLFLIMDEELINVINRKKDESITELLYNVNNFSTLIQNKITYDFYSLYKVFTENWGIENMNNSKIKKWHDEETRRLTNFIINYSNEINESLDQNESGVIV
jgi:hypothetical protein